MPPLAPDHPQIRRLVLDSGSDSDGSDLHTFPHAQTAANKQTGTVLTDDSDDEEEVIALLTQSVPTSSLRTPTQDFATRQPAPTRADPLLQLVMHRRDLRAERSARCPGVFGQKWKWMAKAMSTSSRMTWVQKGTGTA